MNSIGTTHRLPWRVSGAGSETNRPDADTSDWSGVEYKRLSLVGCGDGACRSVFPNLELKDIGEIIEPDHLMTLHFNGRKRPAPVSRKDGQRSAWIGRLSGDPRNEQQQDEHARDVCGDAGSHAKDMISVGL